MAADPSVYGLLKAPAPLPGPLDNYAQLQALALGGLQRRKLETDLNEEEAFKRAVQDLPPGALNAADTYQRLMGISPTRAAAAQKSAMDNAKAQAELAKTKLETLSKSLQLHRDQLANVDTPQAAALWMKAAYNDQNLSPFLQRVGSADEVIARIPQDPKGFQEWKLRNGLGLEKFLENAARERTALETERHHGAVERQATAALAETARHHGSLEEQGRIPTGYRKTADGKLEPIPGGPADIGKALPGPAVKELGGAGTAVENTQRLLRSFKDEYGGKTVLGDLSNTSKRILGDDTGQAQWWQDLEAQQNVTRHELFGSALTSTELAAWNKTSITPRMDSAQIRENLTRRAEIEARAASKLARSYEAAGYNKAQIRELLGGAAQYLDKPAPPVNPAGPKADTKAGPKPPAAGTTFDSMPDPAKFGGRSIRSDDGTVYRSDGKKWVRQAN